MLVTASSGRTASASLCSLMSPRLRWVFPRDSGGGGVVGDLENLEGGGGVYIQLEVVAMAEKDDATFLVSSFPQLPV